MIAKEDFVRELSLKLKEKSNNLFKDSQFSRLKVDYEIKWGSENIGSIKLDGNAKISIPQSLDFHYQIRVFLEGMEIPESVDKQIIVKLTYSIKDNVEKSSSEVPDSSATEDKDEPSPFVAKEPIYTLDQMILPEELLKEMQSAINAVKYQKLIYEDWGFVEVDPVPKCVLNFYGPPGTGKTMAAHALAASIGKKIMEANYGDIESKFVGDAPKNMKKVFERATEEDCVLFFDEADSVMGKRMENASSGAEQAINSLRSETLKHLEQHSGVIIMATNLMTTYDQAFKSRILKSLKFELPNKEARIDMIRKKIPSKMPIDAPISDEQLSELSEIADGMSGREIKNCFIDMAQRKANDCGESAVFTFDDFKGAFSRQKEMMENLKKEERRAKEEKILNALKRKTPEEAKGRIQSLLEDLTPEERKNVMEQVNAKLEEIDRMRAEELKKQEQSNDVRNEESNEQ